MHGLGKLQKLAKEHEVTVKNVFILELLLKIQYLVQENIPTTQRGGILPRKKWKRKYLKNVFLILVFLPN